MKIIFSIYDDLKNPYYAGGGAVAVHELAKSLAKNNDVTVINSRHPNVRNNETIDKVYYKRIGLGVFGPQIDQVLFGLSLPISLLFEKFDVWIETFVPPFSGSFLQSLTTKPVIGVAFFLDADKMQEKYKLPFTILENIVIRNYRYLVATNNKLKEKLKKINPKAMVTTIPLGVSDHLVDKDYGYKEKNYVLYLGRIDIFNKGLDLLLKIAPSILKKNPDLHLVIAGGGEVSQVKLLKKQVKELGLSKKITFTGHVSEKKKIKLISESMLYVFPSRYETFGLSVLEAMALGKPIVVFDISGFDWAPAKYVVKIPTFNTNLFEKKILSLIENKNERIKIGEGAKEFARGLRWRDAIGRYEALLTGTVKKEFLKAGNKIISRRLRSNNLLNYNSKSSSI